MFGKRLLRHLGIIPILISFFQLPIIVEAERTPVIFENTAVVENVMQENVVEETMYEEQTEETVGDETIEQEPIEEETIVQKVIEQKNIAEKTIEQGTVEEESVNQELYGKIQIDIINQEENKRYNASNFEEMHKGRLTAKKGYITDSPCGGSETWYPDAPGGAVKMMENLYGFKELKMEIREDGVRILSGFRPDGEWFEGLVVVAADVRDINEEFERNVNGRFERGDIVETSLGLGIIVDYCERAVNERRANGHIHIDIATVW